MGSPIVRKKIIDSYFGSYIHRRVHEQNKNFIFAITGVTGSGKSWASLRWGEALDPDFDVDNVCFTAREFMNLVNGKAKKVGRGSVLVYDEIQVSMSHMEFQSLQSKMLNYVMQTFRHRNFILIMTSPYMDFINASLRKLMHCKMQTIVIDKHAGTCMIKPLLSQYNETNKKTYWKYLRVGVKGSDPVPLRSITLKKPSRQLIKAYEEKKTNFTSELNKSIQKDLDRLEGKEVKQLTFFEEQVLRMILKRKALMEIADLMDTNTHLVRRQIESLTKKGLTFRFTKDKDRRPYIEVGNLDKVKLEKFK